MSKPLSLDEMSIEEKLNTMESIWNDLVKNAGDVASPDWHQKVLAERSKSITDGTDSLVDWAEAKDQIKKDLK